MTILPTNIYRGWWVHIGLFLCAMIVVGSSSYSFALFVVPVSAELDINRATINNGYIALLLGVGILSPLIGRLLDRFSARLIILSGGVVFAIGLSTLTYTESPLIMLIAILGPVSYGYTACSLLAVNTVIVRWFKRRRGAALGVMAVATSAGGFVFAPLTATMIEHFSWRSALLINAGIAVTVISVLSLLFIRNRPTGNEDGYNLEFNIVDEDDADDAQEEAETEKTWTYRELLLNRNFWLLTFCIGLLLTSDMALMTSNVPYFIDIGIDIQAAAFIVSFMTASAILGKLLVGYVADKVDLRYVFYGVGFAHLALLVVYILQPTYWILFLCTSIFGLGVGGVFPVWSTLLAWLFGTKNYGTVMGLMTIVVKIMSIIGVHFIGRVYDLKGSYVPAFWIFLILVSIGIILASMLRPQSTTEVVIGVERATQ